MDLNEREIVIYTIDKDNCIVSIGEGWDDAAVIGHAEHALQRNRVIGQPIANFISGIVTQKYYEVLFSTCRTKQKPIENEYRCDSPTHQRFMKVALTPHKDGTITLVHETLLQIAFKNRINIEDVTNIASDDSGENFKRCSICNRLQAPLNQEWITPESLEKKENYQFKVIHTVCGDCQAKISTKLHSRTFKHRHKIIGQLASHYLKPLLLVLLGIVGISYVAYSIERNWQVEKYRSVSQNILEIMKNDLQNELSAITLDLLLLAENRDFEEVAAQDKNSQALQRLLRFMRHHQYYDQLRFLDLQGMEKLRINNDGGTPVLVEKDKLQSKATRYYVREALQLNLHEIYISKTDLNKEYGEIEKPYKPTMRVAISVYDVKGQKQGILVLNLRFQKIIDLVFSSKNFIEAPVYLVNGLGEWMVAPEGEKSWEFMFDNASNQLKSYNDTLWNAMQRSKHGSLEDDGSLFSYTHVNPVNMMQLFEEKYDLNQSQALFHGSNDIALQWWLVQKTPAFIIKEAALQNIFKGLPYLLVGGLVLLILSAYLISFYRRFVRSKYELELIETAFENADDGMMITDENTRIIRVNTKYENITGYSSIELTGHTPKMLSSGWTNQRTYEEMWEKINSEGYWNGELIDRRKDGAVYVQWLRIIAIKDQDGKVKNYIGITSDITERKQNQEKIYSLAYEDTLTKLPNRLLLQERLEHAITAYPRHQQPIALMFIDLDDFKLVNDTAGHMTGDKVLIETTARLKKNLRVSDTLSRIGGDEFVILFEQTDKDGLINTSERILKSLSQGIKIDENEYFVSASIGIAFYPDDASDAQTLSQHADTAMYKAKEAGKNSYRFFVSEMNSELIERLQMMNHLKDAVAEGNFTLLYQPQIELQSNQVIGAEALIRWNDPMLGFVSPSDFIPLAESTGLIVPITMWVIEKACNAVTHIQKNCKADISIAINISSIHIKEVNFVESIHTLIISKGVDPKQIELEITEGALIDNIEDTVDKLNQLKSYGYRIAIDDFGTGYSSLSYLKKFGFEKLKIDQSFIRGLPDDVEDVGITKSVISIGKALGMTLIAEGAETQENIDFLRENGCEMVQGYYFSKPLPLNALIDFVRDFNTPKA